MHTASNNSCYRYLELCLFTCLATMLPYSITDMTHCTSPTWRCLLFEIINANIHSSGFDFVGLEINCDKSDITVGIFSANSFETISQRKFLTALSEFLNIESWATEAQSFISDILWATFEITGLDIPDELIIPVAIAW